MTEADILETAKVLRSRKWSWDGIARNLRVSKTWLKNRMVPGFREQSKRVREHHLRVERRSLTGRLDADADRLKAQIPPDTRDLTARIFGDPLPGRSALDQRGMQCEM